MLATKSDDLRLTQWKKEENQLLKLSSGLHTYATVHAISSWKQATANPALGRLIHEDQESEAILGYREIQDSMGHLMSSYLLFINKYIFKKLKCHVNYPALRRLIHEQEFEASLGYRVIPASLGYLLTPVLKKIKKCHVN